MPNSATLFRLLNEFILVLLGGLLILLAVSHRVALSGRPTGFVLLGGILIYWGIRALMRRAAERRPSADTHSSRFADLGWIVDPRDPAISQAPRGALAEIAGVVLVLRALFGSALLIRKP